MQESEYFIPVFSIFKARTSIVYWNEKNGKINKILFLVKWIFQYRWNILEDFLQIYVLHEGVGLNQRIVIQCSFICKKMDLKFFKIKHNMLDLQYSSANFLYSYTEGLVKLFGKIKKVETLSYHCRKLFGS